MKFDDAFELVVGAEGDYSKDPRDKGNWTGGAPNKGQLLGTKYGISAKSYGLKLQALGKTIEFLCLSDAKQIYKIDFWGALKCDLVPSIHAYPLFSCGVNCGVSAAIKLYQEALEVKVDGVLGPQTIRAAIESTDPKEVLGRFCDAWAQYYKRLAKDKPAQGIYLQGWLNRIKEVKKKNY